MNKKIIETFRFLIIDYLSDALLFMDKEKLNNTLIEEKEIATSNYFIDFFKDFLQVIKEEGTYPKEILDNINDITSYISKYNNSDILNECKKIMNSMSNFSYDKYLIDFEKKYYTLENIKKDTYQTLFKDEFAKSLEFDYLFAISMFMDNELYKEECYDSFIMNECYLASLRKTLKILPQFTKVKKYKNRVTEVLKTNIKLLENKDDCIDLYICNNYDSKNNKINKETLSNFKIECEQLLFEIKNKTSFDALKFRDYYNRLKLEYYVYNNSDTEKTFPNLMSIYSFIDDNLKLSYINQKQKNKLLLYLSSFRQYLNGEDLQIYNSYLVKLNLIETKKAEEHLLIKRASDTDYYHYLLYDDDMINRVREYKCFDYINLFYLLLPEDEYKNENFACTYLDKSIEEFIKNNCEILNNRVVLSRIVSALDQYEDKEIDKIKKKLKKKL